MIRRLLIANRGEIAVRILRTCRELGIETVAVYSDADHDAPTVKAADHAVGIGAAPAAQSYLNANALVAAALFTDCDAVHPGYGFLSENARFAAYCARKGLIFVGPSPEQIRLMGDKAAARRVARESGVPVIPGSEGALASIDETRRIAREVGFPLLIKAAAGGGGKGMRVVESTNDLEAALQSARAEALAAFGSADVYVERYLPDVRHVEVQVLGDGRDVVHLGERDCTIQRRHQKLIEETPSPVLSPEQRAGLVEASTCLARTVGYVNAGTVEFVLDNNTGAFFFIEMNTRLQVEHPVTEMTTGIDIVAQQLRIASGDKLAFDGALSKGHAIECRINAEDPQHSFLPQPGTITAFAPPVGASIRVDTHAESGTTISPFYDSLIAKVIVHGDTRKDAIDAMRRALDTFQIDGITTNIALQRSIMDDSRFVSGAFGTHFLEAVHDDP